MVMSLGRGGWKEIFTVEEKMLFPLYISLESQSWLHLSVSLKEEKTMTLPCDSFTPCCILAVFNLILDVSWFDSSVYWTFILPTDTYMFLSLFMSRTFDTTNMAAGDKIQNDYFLRAFDISPRGSFVSVLSYEPWVTSSSWNHAAASWLAQEARLKMALHSPGTPMWSTNSSTAAGTPSCVCQDCPFPVTPAHKNKLYLYYLLGPFV